MPLRKIAAFKCAMYILYSTVQCNMFKKAISIANCRGDSEYPKLKRKCATARHKNSYRVRFYYQIKGWVRLKGERGEIIPPPPPPTIHSFIYNILEGVASF